MEANLLATENNKTHPVYLSSPPCCTRYMRQLTGLNACWERPIQYQCRHCRPSKCRGLVGFPAIATVIFPLTRCELIRLVKPAEELDGSEEPRITIKFSGNYRRIEDGQYVFTVTKADADQSKIAEKYQNLSVGWEKTIQSSRDDFGNLLFVRPRLGLHHSDFLHSDFDQDHKYMHWENYWKKVP